MSFGEHLEDLRRRLLRSIYGVLIVCFLTFYYGADIVVWLLQPVIDALRDAGQRGQVIAPKVTTGFVLYMKVSLIAAIVIAAPWVLYQIWQFVAVGLYHSERRVVAVLAPFSAIMTLLGVLFLYYIILPLALSFLIAFNAAYIPPGDSGPTLAQRIGRRFAEWSGAPQRPRRPTATLPSTWPATVPATGTASVFGMVVPLRTQLPDPATLRDGETWIQLPQNELRVYFGAQTHVLALSADTAINPLIDADEYIDFVMWMGLAIVIAFQLPGVMMILGWTRLVQPRTVARVRKYCVFVCFVVAAVITPTGDPFNMTLLAIPLWGLFEFGLVLMRVSYRIAERRAQAEEAQSNRE